MLPHEHSSVLANTKTTAQTTHREFILTIFCPAFLHCYRAAEEAPALAAAGPEPTRYRAPMCRRGKDHRLRAVRPLRTGRNNTPAGLNPAKVLIIRSTTRTQRLFCVFFSPLHEKRTVPARHTRRGVFCLRQTKTLFCGRSDARFSPTARVPDDLRKPVKNALRHCAKRYET